MSDAEQQHHPHHPHHHRHHPTTTSEGTAATQPGTRGGDDGFEGVVELNRPRELQINHTAILVLLLGIAAFAFR